VAVAGRATTTASGPITWRAATPTSSICRALLHLPRRHRRQLLRPPVLPQGWGWTGATAPWTREGGPRARVWTSTRRCGACGRRWRSACETATETASRCGTSAALTQRSRRRVHQAVRCRGTCGTPCPPPPTAPTRAGARCRRRRTTRRTRSCRCRRPRRTATKLPTKGRRRHRGGRWTCGAWCWSTTRPSPTASPTSWTRWVTAGQARARQGTCIDVCLPSPSSSPSFSRAWCAPGGGVGV